MIYIYHSIIGDFWFGGMVGQHVIHHQYKFEFRNCLLVCRNNFRFLVRSEHKWNSFRAMLCYQVLRWPWTLCSRNFYKASAGLWRQYFDKGLDFLVAYGIFRMKKTDWKWSSQWNACILFDALQLEWSENNIEFTTFLQKDSWKSSKKGHTHGIKHQE